MVPISKSIWVLILFVCANFRFAAMMRLNLFHCFSFSFSRERSKLPPPNFVPSFCALCLNVCDFLPKTWDLGRKITPSVCSRWSQPPSPRGRLDPLSHRCAMPAPPRGGAFGIAMKFPAKVQSRQALPERARMLPAARLFPQETSAAAAVCLYDPSCEKGVQESPQTFLNPEI